MPDAVKEQTDRFVNLSWQIKWLCDRLSEARILVNHAQCCRCRWMSKEKCSLCWREAAARAVKKERQAQCCYG